MGAEQSGLAPSELVDLEKSTKFTGQEITQWYTKFHTEFPEGHITQDQFTKVYQNMFPGGNAKAFARNVFRAYDTDGNGEIDFKEFLSTLSISTKGSLEDKLKWAFNMYDINGDGYIDQDELTSIIEGVHKMKGVQDGREQAESMALQVLISMDKNKDRKLTLREFINGAKKSKKLAALFTSMGK